MKPLLGLILFTTTVCIAQPGNMHLPGYLEGLDNNVSMPAGKRLTPLAELKQYADIGVLVLRVKAVFTRIQIFAGK